MHHYLSSSITCTSHITFPYHIISSCLYLCLSAHYQYPNYCLIRCVSYILSGLLSFAVYMLLQLPTSPFTHSLHTWLHGYHDHYSNMYVRCMVCHVSFVNMRSNHTTYHSLHFTISHIINHECHDYYYLITD
jgi:hypothetical protein